MEDALHVFLSKYWVARYHQSDWLELFAILFPLQLVSRSTRRAVLRSLEAYKSTEQMAFLNWLYCHGVGPTRFALIMDHLRQHTCTVLTGLPLMRCLHPSRKGINSWGPGTIQIFLLKTRYHLLDGIVTVDGTQLYNGLSGKSGKKEPGFHKVGAALSDPLKGKLCLLDSVANVEAEHGPSEPGSPYWGKMSIRITAFRPHGRHTHRDNGDTAEILRHYCNEIMCPAEGAYTFDGFLFYPPVIPLQPHQVTMRKFSPEMTFDDTISTLTEYQEAITETLLQGRAAEDWCNKLFSFKNAFKDPNQPPIMLLCRTGGYYQLSHIGAFYILHVPVEYVDDDVMYPVVSTRVVDSNRMSVSDLCHYWMAWVTNPTMHTPEHAIYMSELQKALSRGYTIHIKGTGIILQDF